MKALALALCLAVLLPGPAAHCCSFDTDCAAGSSCLKGDTTDLYGVCSDGINPGNANDRKPVTQFGNARFGNTCTSDFDCGIGHRCAKGSGFKGVCQ